MDNDEFLKRLSEVSEWHRPMLGPNGCYSVNKNAKQRELEKPREITEQELDEMTDSEAQAYYDALVAWRETQPNDSLQPEILKVKVQAIDCPDCGRHCPQGRRTERKLHLSGSKHWREKCCECKNYRDPMSGEFTVSCYVAHQYLTQVFKPKMGKNNSKYQKVNKEEKQEKPKPPEPEYENVSVKKEYWLIKEHGDGVIRELRSIEKIEQRLKRR
jgi:hypothetical protein